jgi:ABC-type antimicrobial peptide transport system permease subunit
VEEEIDRSILQERLTAMLSAFFGALALLLGAIGLYGLMAYGVTQRIPEIAIRFALGAPRSTVQWMVLRETLVLALIGVAIGVPCAVMASRFIASMLFGLSAHDPVTLAVAVTVLLAAAALAGFLPSRKAMRVDPIVALRHE